MESPVLTGSSVMPGGVVPSNTSSSSSSSPSPVNTTHPIAATSNLHLSSSPSSNNITKSNNNVLVQQLIQHNGGGGPESGSQSSSQKRPMNAFLIFCKRHRSVVKSKYPHLENRSITKILGEWWAALDADQKQKYTELARQYKEAFMKANPHFKWYKTDNFTPRAPPPMQHSSSSSPPHHGLQSLHLNNNSSSETIGVPTSGSAAAAAVVPQSGPPISQPLTGDQIPVMGIMKETQVHVNNNNHINHNSSNSPAANNNSTPKPPKKRYLENSEFRSTLAGPMPGVQQPPVNSVTATNLPSISTSVTPSTTNSNNNPVNNNNSLVAKSADKKASIAPLGPPGMLDVDTMSRVIVDALAAGPNPAPSTYMNYDRTSPPTALAKPSVSVSDGEGGSLSNGLPSFGMRGRSSSPESPSYHQSGKNDRSGTNSPIEHNGPKIQSVASLTAESLLIAESQQPLGSATKTVAAIVSAKHSNSSTGSILASLGTSSTPSSSSATVPSPSSQQQSMEEDKPLNLSSSKVLHASHQQIIDHFIDKLLSSGGECGEGNPMPVEMMQTSSSLPSPNCLPPPPTAMASASPVTGNSSKNGPKKERTCKGKRYLDMINESKSGSGNSAVNQPGGKKCKNSTTGSGEGGESPTKDKNSSGASKWVSGGFDLEEHIAALPQLGDAHLLTALNNSKNKGTVVVNGNGGSNHGHHGNHHHRQGRNNSDSDGSRSPSSPSGHGDGRKAVSVPAFNQINSNKSDSESSSSEPCLKIGEDQPMSDKSNSRSGSISSRTNSPVNTLTNGHGSPTSGTTHNFENESSSTTSDQKRSMVARELLASAGFNLSRSSQGIEVGPCDGLAALAEVALSQAQAISTTTSS